MGTATTDETRLVARARSGSVDAAGELFSLHWLSAWRAAYAMTGNPTAAEDIA